ncbi:Protein FAR1-RELATED SEQUENCE 5, partial [Linum grandiflorum]
MKFDCEDAAYEFYTTYAHGIGFSVRKSFVKRTKSSYCSKQGEKCTDKRSAEVAYEKPITRVGCLAEMTCQLQTDDMLEIVKFEATHNYELAPIPVKHMLRCNRKLSYAQKVIADDAAKAGLPIKWTIDLL